MGVTVTIPLAEYNRLLEDSSCLNKWRRELLAKEKHFEIIETNAALGSALRNMPQNLWIAWSEEYQWMTEWRPDDPVNKRLKRKFIVSQSFLNNTPEIAIEIACGTIRIARAGKCESE